MRRSLFEFIIRKVFKVKIAEILPKGLRILKVILFPLETYCIVKGPIRYDWRRKVYTIFGVQYSENLFRLWAKDGLPVGTWFQLVERKEDGAITIGRLNEALEEEFRKDRELFWKNFRLFLNQQIKVKEEGSHEGDTTH